MKTLINNLKPLNQTDNTRNLYEILDFIIKKFELNQLIKNIKFYNKNDNIYGFYDPKNLEININENNDIYLSSFLNQDKLTLYDLTEYKNASIIITMLHECRHAFQTLTDLKRVYYKNDDIYSNIIGDFISLNDEEYDKIYDTNPLEKDAETTAYEQLLYLLPYMTKNKRIINYFSSDYYNIIIRDGYIDNKFNNGSLETNYKNILNKYEKYISLKPRLLNINTFDKIKINEELNQTDIINVYEEKKQYIKK